MDILHNCWEILLALHFKTLVIENELATASNKVLIEDIFDTYAEVKNILEWDNQYSAGIEDDDGDCEDKDGESSKSTNHTHRSLKLACLYNFNSSKY